MAKFRYTAINSAGNKIDGTKSAQNKDDLLAYLNGRGLTVISIREDLNLDIDRVLNIEIGGMGLSDKVLISKQLSTMLTAGIPIIQAVGIIRDQAEKKNIKEKFAEVFRKIEAGEALSTAFREVGGMYNEVQLHLIEAGEKSGNLNEMLQKISDDLEESKNLRGKILGAMIYPAIIFLVLIVVFTIMVVFMVPQVQELYSTLGQDELPFITNILVSISDFLTSVFAIVVIPVFLITTFFTYRAYVSRESGRLSVDRFKLRIPVFGNLFQKAELTQFCRVTSMLLQSGVPVIDTIQIVSNSMSNAVHKRILANSVEEVKKGSTISLSIARNNDKRAFPPILVKVISTGEEAGKLDLVLNDMYKYYNAEVEQMTNNLTRLLEPFILVIVGGFVATLAIAIYLPIYQVGNFI